MTEIPEGLTPANQNPWYVLMTLYGEQEREVDWDLHDKNRAAWNAWACQGIGDEARAKAAESSAVTVAELSAWPEVQADVAQQHRQEWARRNGDSVPYPGVPDPDQAVDLRRVEFEHRLRMEQTVFSRHAWFREGTFSGGAGFDRATFSGHAGFRGATFSGPANFGGATISGRAEFDRVTVGGEAWFLGVAFREDAGFGRATFSEQAWFGGATFGGLAHFGGARFSGQAGFAGATFGGKAWFGGTTFSEAATFRGATFSGHTRFNGATFSGFTDFSKANFGTPGDDQEVTFTGGDQPVTFTDCQFQKPTNFRAAVFHARYPDFAGAVLHDTTTFTDHSDNWPKGDQPDAAQAKASCAVIRHALGKQGLPKAEHFF